MHNGFEPQGSHAVLYTSDTDCSKIFGVMGTRSVSETMTMTVVSDDMMRERSLREGGVGAGVIKLELDIVIDDCSRVRRK